MYRLKSIGMYRYDRKNNHEVIHRRLVQGDILDKQQNDALQINGTQWSYVRMCLVGSGFECDSLNIKDLGYQSVDLGDRTRIQDRSPKVVFHA